jgi:hypothetical protein
MDCDMERMTLHFGNLFNGNKMLGEIPVHIAGDTCCWVRYLFKERETQVGG